MRDCEACGVAVFASDAPARSDVAGDDYHRPGTHPTDVVAADHDGERYCLDCISDAYLALDDRDIPHGGVVFRGSEVDVPMACGRCGRRLADLTVIGQY